TLDTTRADRLGCYGYESAETPNFDRLADAAVLFEQAVSPVPTTLPSHSTLFTGRYPQDHGVRYNLVYRLGPEAVTLAEYLHGAGFATAGFPSAYVLAPAYGLDQGFDTYSADSIAPPGGDPPTDFNGLRAGRVVDDAIAWLDGRSESEKQFAWLHFYDPHAPYDPPFPYSSRYRGRPYDGEIAYMDAQFGRLLARLESSPAWAQTLLIVAGDHGEGLHEHRERFHANLIYETTQRVPLFIRLPAGSARRIEEPVTLADITPTLLDLLGIEAAEKLRGISLADVLRGDEPPRRDIYFESLAGAMNYGWQELRGIRYGPWKLIQSDDAQLFHLDDDPGESSDLASLEGERVADMSAALSSLAEPLDGSSAAELAHDPVTSPETERFLASLGYVAGGSGGSAEGAANPRELIDLEPELLAGQLSVGAGDWEAVEGLCRYVLERDPKNKWALGNLVGALIRSDRFEEAQDTAVEIIRHYPDREQGYLLLARCYRAEERVDEAFRVLSEGLERVGESAGLRYFYIVAGFEVDAEGLCEETVPRAVESHPDSARLTVMLARCEAGAGKTDAALDTLARAVELGFPALEQLKEGEEFEEVMRHPRFAELLAEVDRRRAEREKTAPEQAEPEGS
ncbi:MAG TPA: sulfatase-like hydrolase/transferase, partial [Candidatus Polarisedimenticolaceae bacterium]|nr:sulfatase-like hydrolase/transferase [Candidatus Polarisedimenticolaceae bacterium]